MGEAGRRGLTRRQFLAAGLAAAGGGLLSGCERAARLFLPSIKGRIVGASHAAGHLLRGGRIPAPASEEKAAVAVVGGGIGGLSAAWALDNAGLRDYRVLDLEPQAGGNSRWAEGPVSPHPWGAHYIPLPGPSARLVSTLLREMKVEIGRDKRGKPVYDERYLCHAPQERLFIHGKWQEGLFPRIGATADDLKQWERFEKHMDDFRRLRGSDGRKAFDLPMEFSSRDPKLLALDRVNMTDWLSQNGYSSPRLLWLVDYSCRDDYGCRASETSAWAGIHYFAARGAGGDDQVLTWPEGNGFVARYLAAGASGRLRTSALAFKLEQNAEGVAVDYYDIEKERSVRLRARAAILAVPQFVARRLMPSLPERKSFTYAPWMVANLTVEDPPEGKGAAPAWDNVLYKGESLGYVVATHQSHSLDRRASVWTYYLPLTGAPAARRAEALERPWEGWRDLVLNDLAAAHPELKDRVRRLDVMVWGHGMIRPSPGFIWGGERAAAAKPAGRVFFAHSDLSGLSLFEEAQYRGVAAAEGALAALKRPYRSLL